MFDYGYVSHCFGVYLIGFVAIIMFVAFNYDGSGELIKGFLFLSGMYSLIFALCAMAVPILGV